MTIIEIMQQAQHLSARERKELVKLLVDSLDVSENGHSNINHEGDSSSDSAPVSAIDTLLSIRIEDAPPDWSENIDKYLYGWHEWEDENDNTQP